MAAKQEIEQRAMEIKNSRSKLSTNRDLV